MDRLNHISQQVIGACIEVHRVLGPGLLESAYEDCLGYELKDRGIHFEQQKPLPVVYKGNRLDCGYRLDFVIEGQLINFNVPLLKKGIKRLVNNFCD